MRLIDEHSATEFLRSMGRIGAGEGVNIAPLAGGVSNVVLLVRRESGGENFVLKQAREQLRVAQPWFCSVERIWREVEVLRACRQVCEEDSILSEAAGILVSTPRLLFEDRDHYCYAMSAAPPHVVWKTRLLAGRTDEAIATACGRFLARLHGRTWGDEKLAAQLGDRRFFEDLRVDPYYRSVQRRHDDLRDVLNELIDSVTSIQLALVHGDYSPKNLLVYDGGVMLVDFEVGHFGDPAFDLGFFLSHLLLKAIRAAGEAPRYVRLVRAFQDAYEEELKSRVDAAQRAALHARGVLNLGGCMLARVDGKSPVEYLGAAQQETARRVARLLLQERPAWEDVVDRVEKHVKTDVASAEQG